MHPTLFEVFGRSIHAYPVFVGGAFVLCTVLALRAFRRDGLDFPPLLPFGGFLGALFGARLWFNLQQGRPLWRALYLWEGGVVFFGGLLGGAIVVIAVLIIRKAPVLKVADAAIPYVALGQAIGRFGCFLNGCCWGTVSNQPWAVQFPEGSVAHGQHLVHGLVGPGALTSLPVHPTQLYSAVALLALFVALIGLQHRKRFDGATLAGYLFLYGATRFVVEFFRGDVTPAFWRLTAAQWTSVALVAGAGLVFYSAGTAAFSATERRHRQPARDSHRTDPPDPNDQSEETGEATARSPQ